MKLLNQGAEAQIFLLEEEEKILKKRLQKSYRHPLLDAKIIKKRTQMEFTLLKKLQSTLFVPKLYSKSLSEITMEYIPGVSLKEYLLLQEKQLDIREIAAKVSQIIKTTHDQNIIHGDLTCMNILYHSSSKKFIMIDFGLGCISRKEEDKAVDLYVFKKSLDPLILNEFWDEFIRNYSDEKVLNRLLIVENRGRKM
jgi:TP53 regulating kinase-like protein